MNRLTLLLLLLVFLSPAAFAQSGAQVDGGRFLKRIEDNFKNKNTQIIDGKEVGIWNFDGKTEVEMLLFGDRNAKAEFFFSPSFEGASGFRLVRDSSDTGYLLEVKRISNYKEASEQVAEKFPSIGIPAELYLSIPKDIDELVFERNSAMYSKQAEEKLKLYATKTLSFPVSDRFAERLYARMVSAIDNFRVEGKPDASFDGYRVTFRCVAGDELRSLNIHMPQGDALAFSDLCRQIATDAVAGRFDESKYIGGLKK